MRFLCHTQQKYREDKTTPLTFWGVVGPHDVSPYVATTYDNYKLFYKNFCILC